MTSGEKWALEGQLQNGEIVFSNQSLMGKQVIDSGETAAGAERFVAGAGRHGK